MEDLVSLIEQWNMNRLQLFALSPPNENGEFHGVMRFCYQDTGQKVATKCVRVYNTATTLDVIDSLIEKFRADIKMLSVPQYGLYEIHENGEERKLGDDERPLLVQLNWHKDDREGRFLLKRIDEKSTPESGTLTRKLSKNGKKNKQKKEKNEESKESGLAGKLYDELPETCFTRSISNPEAVMKRRRKQKLEKKLQQLQQNGPDAGGTLRIFGESLNPDVPYKTLLLSSKDTARYVVTQILEKYREIGNFPEAEVASSYCLVLVIEPSPDGLIQYVLNDNDCPLAIKQKHDPRQGQLTFHIRKRSAECQPQITHVPQQVPPQIPQQVPPQVPPQVLSQLPSQLPSQSSQSSQSSPQLAPQSHSMLPPPYHHAIDPGNRIYDNLHGVARSSFINHFASPPSPLPVPCTIQLQKSVNGLGFSIVAARSSRTGPSGIYVKSIIKGGTADLDGRLQPGDQLLSVNRHSLIDIPQEEAAKLMTQSSIVRLEVAKKAGYLNGLATLFNEVHRATPSLPPQLPSQLPPQLAPQTPPQLANQQLLLQQLHMQPQYLPPYLKQPHQQMHQQQPYLQQSHQQLHQLNQLHHSHTQPNLNPHSHSHPHPHPHQQPQPQPQHLHQQLYQQLQQQPQQQQQQLQSNQQSNQQSHQQLPQAPNQQLNKLPSQLSHQQPHQQTNQQPNQQTQQQIHHQLSHQQQPHQQSHQQIHQQQPHQQPNQEQSQPQQPHQQIHQQQQQQQQQQPQPQQLQLQQQSQQVNPHHPLINCASLLKEISEALEMDDENDPTNNFKSYGPNVIGAHEIYKDPRERIEAEKMKTQPQKTIIAGPEKLTFKEKLQLFAEE